MKTSGLAAALLLSLFVSSTFPHTAAAQEQRGTGFVFTLDTPGARALGMGGTSIGFADDSTAAAENPAGMTQLQEPELWASLRSASFENPALVDFDGTTSDFDDDLTSPAFVGYVHPVAAGAAAFGVYYRRSENVLTHSAFADDDDPIEFVGIDFLIDEEIAVESVVQTFGGAVAFRLGDHVALGGTVGFSNLDWSQSRTLRLMEAASPEDGVALDVTHDEVEDSDISFSGGILFNPDGEISGGVVYRRGPEFQIERRLDPSCFGDFGGPLCQEANFTVDTADLVLPSVLGAGIAFRAEGLGVGADVLRVGYSELADSFEFVFGFPADEPIEDEVVFRAGGEYEMRSGGFIGAVRAGVFTDPDHDGIAALDTDRIHYTFGGGAAFAQVFRVDGAVNLADDVTELMVSLALRFR